MRITNLTKVLVFGFYKGSREFERSDASGSTSAYMLFYVKKSLLKEIFTEIPPDTIPKQIIYEIEEDNKRASEEKFLSETFQLYAFDSETLLKKTPSKGVVFTKSLSKSPSEADVIVSKDELKEMRFPKTQTLASFNELITEEWHKEQVPFPFLIIAHLHNVQIPVAKGGQGVEGEGYATRQRPKRVQ